MSFGNLIWVFFILSMMQPLLNRRLLEAQRRRLIAQIERGRNWRVILLVHRQETMSLLGFPLMRYIDIHDWEEVVRAIDMTDPRVPLDLVLHTPGGLVLAALQIARAIHEHPGKVAVFVPHYAMSGGTLIALAANEIVMSKHAVLGPVDPQLGQMPAASLLRVLADKPIAEIDDKTIVLADQAGKAIRQVHAAIKELTEGRHEPDKAEELAKLLSEGTWTHDHPITFAEAKNFGLPVRSDMPEDVFRLMSLFPQPKYHQAGVEFLPGHHHYRAPGSKSAVWGESASSDHRGR
jgi:ClpP class serine protease